MKTLHDEKRNRAILIAESEDDWKTLKFLDSKAVVFGLHQLKERDDEVPEFIRNTTAVFHGVAYINIISGYVPCKSEVDTLFN